MKKLIKFLFSFVIGIIIFALLAVGITGFIVYDGSDINNYQIKDNPKSSLVIINNSLQEGSQETKSSEDVELLLDIVDLNYLFYNVAESIVIEEENISITGVSLGVKDGNYLLQVSINAYGFKTIFIAGLNFLKDENGISIKLSDLNLGKLSFLKLSKLFIKGISNEQVQDYLAKANIDCKIDLSNYQITFSYDNIKTLLIKALKDSNEALLIDLLVDLIINNDELITFNLGNNDMFGIILHLKDIKHLNTIEDNYSLVDIEAKCEKLLNSNIIEVNDVNLVFNYLVNGYDSLTDENKQKIEQFDFSSISIMDNRYHKGLSYFESYTLNNYLVDNITLSGSELLSSLMTDNKLTIAISEQTINKTLRSIKFIGQSYAYANEYNNNVSYMTIKHFLVDLKQDKMFASFIFDICDVEAYIKLSLSSHDNKGLEVSYKLDDISLGNNSLTSSQCHDLLTYLSRSMTNIDYLSIDANNDLITFNFANALANNSNIQDMLNLASNSYDVNSQIQLVDGAINISYNI